MGSRTAASLRHAGFARRVFDIRAGVGAAFAGDGGTACASAAELGAACDVVVSVVVNAAQTEDLLFGGGGVAGATRRSRVFVMCSTVDPNWTVALVTRLEALSLWMLDASISGGAAKGASGQMTMISSGRPEAYAPCDAVQPAMAATVYKLAPRAGAGSKVKIINQLLAGVHIAASAEAMAPGLREGVDPAAPYKVITHSAGNSWMFENRIAHVLAGDYPPLSAVDRAPCTRCSRRPRVVLGTRVWVRLWWHHLP